MRALSHGNAARGYSALERSEYEAPLLRDRIPREGSISLQYIYNIDRKHDFIVDVNINYIM